MSKTCDAGLRRRCRRKTYDPRHGMTQLSVSFHARPCSRIDSVPIDAMQRVCHAVALRDVFSCAFGSKVMLELIRCVGIRVEVWLHIKPDIVDVHFENAKFHAQYLRDCPLVVHMAIPQDLDLDRSHKYGTILRKEVVAVQGLLSLSGFQACAKEWRLRALKIDELADGEVDLLCTFLTSHSSLELLHIDNFCPDNPSADQLAPVLTALPKCCSDLRIRYALPVTRAFAMIPSTVHRLGTVVLMHENYYHSRVAGMTLSKFAKAFPILPNILALDIILGPGHYEEPEWSRTGAEVGALLKIKFPMLTHLIVEAVLESASAPPLQDLTKKLTELGVRVEFRSLHALRGASAVLSILKRTLPLAGAIMNC